MNVYDFMEDLYVQLEAGQTLNVSFPPHPRHILLQNNILVCSSFSFEAVISLCDVLSALGTLQASWEVNDRAMRVTILPPGTVLPGPGYEEYFNEAVKDKDPRVIFSLRFHPALLRDLRLYGLLRCTIKHSLHGGYITEAYVETIVPGGPSVFTLYHISPYEGGAPAAGGRTSRSMATSRAARRALSRSARPRSRSRR